MTDDSQERTTEQTPKGLTVPVPKRGEFFGNLTKVSEPDKPVEAPEDTAPPHGDPLAD
jgi:hypothetical protein